MVAESLRRVLVVACVATLPLSAVPSAQAAGLRPAMGMSARDPHQQRTVSLKQQKPMTLSERRAQVARDKLRRWLRTAAPANERNAHSRPSMSATVDSRSTT